jgi:trehalose utilization protein
MQPRATCRTVTFAVLFIAALSLIQPPATRAAEASAKPIRVLVWDERQPAQKQAYENFLGNAIADHLGKQPGLKVKSAALDDPEQGVPGEALDDCDVLIWWGHVRNREVTPEHARAIVDRIKAGRLSMITLHSAHWSPPFVLAMNERTTSDALAAIPEAERARIKITYVQPTLYVAPKRDAALTPSFMRIQSSDGADTLQIVLPICCFPAFRPDGKPGHLTTLLPDHPIARGIPATFDVPQTEMYDEPFHVPKPDAVIFEERWDAGEHFRSGCLWRVGKGRVFYFRPGHEIYPVYRQEIPLKIIENAVRYLGSKD